LGISLDEAAEGRPPGQDCFIRLRFEEGKAMAVLYISPTGSGTHSGTSAANAGTIADLPRFITAAGPGGEVRLLADRGAYTMTKQVTITDGGAAGAPVTVRGVNASGQPMAATFVGTRAANWKPGLAEGTELFRLMSGADHLKFVDLAAKNIGNGVFRIGASIGSITIERVTATNVSRFIENYVSGSATTASVNWLTVKDVTISGYSRNAIRLQYDSRNIKLQNVVGDSQKQNGGLIIAGVSLAGTVHDVLLDHVTMKNNYGRGGSGDYWNGDGFVAEGGTYNLTFQDTVASGNTDAGYDIKADNVTLIRATGSGNTKNFRLWGQAVTMMDSVSANPQSYGGVGKVSHVMLPSGAEVTLDNLRISDTSTTTRIFDLSNGGNLLKLVDMAMPPVSRVQFGNNSMIKLPTGLVVNGTSGNDSLAGGTGADMLIGGKGNDTYTVNNAGDRPVEEGTEGTDLVRTTLASYTLADHLDNLSYTGSAAFNGNGNTLSNAITGGAGNDWLKGASGNDTLTGGQGTDTYWFGRGDDNDTIYNNDTGASPDRLMFGSGIAEDQLWFAKNGNDLLVTLRGTGGSDTVRVKGWYSASSNQLGKLQLSDGTILAASHVQQLVQAMASFTTSAGAPTSLSGAQQDQVETVIAANWQNPA
jgi:Ca2+-binding RTX toxin-like protein